MLILSKFLSVFHLMEKLLELADLQRVRRGLWQEPVIPQGGQGPGAAHYPGTEVTLTMNTLGSCP